MLLIGASILVLLNLADANELSPAIADVVTSARQAHEEKLRLLSDSRERSDAWGQLGMLYHANQLRLLAMKAYSRALEEQTTPKWLYLRGIVRGEMGDIEGSLDDFQSFLGINPDNSVGWYRLGVASLLDGDIKAARTAFENAIDTGKTSAVILVGLADVAFSEGDSITAIDWLEKAYRMEPQSGQLAYKLAMAFQRVGKTKIAKQWLEKVGEERIAPPIRDPLLLEVAKLSRSARFYEIAAEWSLARGERGEAIDALLTAIEIAPANVNLGMRLISMLEDDGRDREALALVERLRTGGNGSNRRLQYVHAWLLRESTDQNEVTLADQLAETAAVDRNEEKPMRLAGSLAMRVADYQRAYHYFGKLAQDYPSAYYSYWSGMAASAIGNCEGIYDFEEALRREPKWADAHIGLTRALAVCGKSPLSKERAQALLSMHDSVDTRLTLAFAELAMGKLNIARRIATSDLPHPEAKNILEYMDASDRTAQLLIFAPNSERWNPIITFNQEMDP